MQEDAVRSHIDKNIISQLNRRPPKYISTDILYGIIELVSDKDLNETKLVSQLFKDFFPKWLSEIKELMVFKNNDSEKSK